MNIRITHNWLLEYLDTDASPYEIQKYLSLAGPSVDQVEKNGDDYVYEIEVTSNRIDTASVFGVAQECQAILPQYGKKAQSKLNPLLEYKFSNLRPGGNHSLDVKIIGKNLCSRFTALVLDNIEITKSPDFISHRLMLCGVKSINNIIDISNYLMLGLGQPTHIFNYDQIADHQMIMRESRKDERIITLDEKELILPGGDIVIEDGTKRLIDLCGIMGGLNSAVTEKTKRILLFVQTYNKNKIRKTSLTTGQRTIASTYFEKGLDEDRVESTLVYGVHLLQQYAAGEIASPLYDIYPARDQPKKISLQLPDVKRLIGIEIKKEVIIKMLENLGFRTASRNNQQLIFDVPSYRATDVAIKEDLIEEISRIYGYQNLPNNLQSTVYVAEPKEMEELFVLQLRIKYFLKHLGLHEVINYSMISQELIESLGLTVKEHLSLSNTISEEIKYMRTSLLPSLIKNIKDNQGKKDRLKFFEIGKVYYQKTKDLPDEQYKLGIATNTNFAYLKGVIEAVLSELNITDYEIAESTQSLLAPPIQGQLIIKDKSAGYFGQLRKNYTLRQEIKGDIYLAEIDLQALIDNWKIFPVYKQINPFATIKLDLDIKQSRQMPYERIKKIAFETSKLLDKIEVISLFKNNFTLRFYFSHKNKNITEEEAKAELEKIKVKLLV